MITDGVLVKDDMRCVLGDCLEVMKDIEDGSVDMILCDLPYGLSTTTCKWDKMIPVDRLWAEYKRIIKGEWCYMSVRHRAFQQSFEDLQS